MPEIRFKVEGGDVQAYFDRIKQQGNQLANSLIQNAKNESASAKETLATLNEQLSVLERKNKLANEISRVSASKQLEGKSGEIAAMKASISQQITESFREYKAGGISQQEYTSRYKSGKERIGQLDEEDQAAKLAYADYSKNLKEESDEEKIQTKLAKELLDETKQSSRDYLKALKRGEDATKLIANAKSPADKLAIELAKERYEKEKKGGGESSDSDGLKKLIGGVVGVSTLTGLISNFGKLAQTKSGFDLIAPAEEFKGRMVGSIVGGVVGAIAGSFIGGQALAGASIGSGAGSALGSAFGGVSGGFEQRRAIDMQNYLGTRNRYYATTGNNSLSNIPMEEYGLADKDYIDLIRNSARTAGSSSRSSKYASDSYFAEKGYGVDQGTSSSLIELQRSSKENNKDLANLIGGVLKSGQGSIFKNGDQSYLNEFLGKFVSLQKQLLQNQNAVNSGETMGLLKAFNGVGGMFSSQDSRSMPLISQVNNSLSNPSGDSAKGLLFLALRRQMPGANSYQIQEEMQKGLGSDIYRKAAFGAVDMLGGDENYKMFQFAGITGLGNRLGAARDLYGHRRDQAFLSKYSDIDTTTDLSGKAKEYTTDIDREMAKLSNGLLKNVYESVDAMEKAFSTAMENVAGKFVVVLNNGRYELKIQDIKKNVTKTPSSSQRANGLDADYRPDPRSAMNRM